MVKTVFLDTCVFFDSIEDHTCNTIIKHAYNLDFKIVTSITVIGEAIDQMREHDERDYYFSSFISLLDDWGVYTYYPDPVIAEICYRLSTLDIDYRVEKTDRVHIGYAIANGCDYFITSDSNLQKYRIPRELESVNFFKPVTISLEDFKTILK